MAGAGHVRQTTTKRNTGAARAVAPPEERKT